MQRAGMQASYPFSDASSASRWAGLTVVVASHALVLGALLSYAPAREALVKAVPIMVTFITPPPPEPPKPKPRVRPPDPPKPVPVQEPVEPPPIVVAAPVDAPAPYVAPPPPPPPPAPVVVAPPAPPVAITPRAPPPPPIVPPRFDAAYLENPPPAYPALSRRMREQGRVILRVLVSPEGRAQRVELRTPSGSQRLDASALETVRRWRFVPARQGTEAVPAWVLVPISFSLEG